MTCPCAKKTKKRGLKGTVAEHRVRAQKLLAEARRELRSGDCATAASTAHQAEAEAYWLPGGRGRGTIKHEASSLAYQAEQCIRERRSLSGRRR